MEHDTSRHSRGYNAPAQHPSGENRPKAVRDRKLRADLESVERKQRAASVRATDAQLLQAAQPGFLAPGTPLERTYKIRQEDIREASGRENAKKSYELQLDQKLGPYLCQYNRNGKILLLSGSKGHVAGFAWRHGRLKTEVQLGESIRDATWLHNDQYFALAQRTNVFIYDSAGVELHRLSKHCNPLFLQFLPYHYLLASLSTSGSIVYTDTSIGKTLTPLATKLGRPTALAQNPGNAILHVGHQSGAVTLWSPNSSSALAKLLPHNGPVRALRIDHSGRYMISSSQEQHLAVWDLRQMRELRKDSLHQPGRSIDVSQTGLVAVGWGSHVSIWKDLLSSGEASLPSPYMLHATNGERVERVAFCPYEDVCGITTSKRFLSLLIPGAGEPNFDATEVNPYETLQQRQAMEVQTLLDKIQPEMISIDQDLVGVLSRTGLPESTVPRENPKAVANRIEVMSKRGRGKNSALRKYLRKSSRKNVVDEKRLKVERALKMQGAKAVTLSARSRAEYGPALARFTQDQP